MLRVVALLGLGACASGVCDSCPSVSLSVNGMSTITAPAGTPLTYTWDSANADTVRSSVAVEPISPDPCGIQDGPWVVDTLTGTTEPVELAQCQSGSTYTLVVTVAQSSTGDSTSATVLVSVP